MQFVWHGLAEGAGFNNSGTLRFGIKVEDGEVIPGNFETFNRIRAFVESKKSGGGLRPTEA